MPDKRPIFLDHHSTTPVDQRVLEKMLPYFSEDFGNAASRAHRWGIDAEHAVASARNEVAALIGAQSSEVIFTSGATESNNLAIKGAIDARKIDKPHLITSAIEHKSILDSVEFLKARGVSITLLPVDRMGRVDPDSVAAAITPNTVVISIMLSNNEVGTVNPISNIAQIAQQARVLFHCDAAQGLGYIPLNVHAAGIDLLSMSAHKMYGPKGIGALFVSRRVIARDQIYAQIHGGGHEQGLRSGTLNVPGIVGMGAACALMKQEGIAEAKRLRELRDDLQKSISSACTGVHINGDPDNRHPGNLNMSVDDVDGSALLLQVNQKLAVSSGAACSSARDEGSYVLRAMNVPTQLARASIRFGLGRHTTESDVAIAADTTKAAIQSLRRSH